MIEQIKAIAKEAGKAILEIYNKEEFKITEKNEQGRISPLTEADLKANAIITGELKALTPNIPILTEEGKDNKERLKSRECWIVDPLDGTKEFIKRNGEFTVNIALVRGHKPILGVIYAPVLNKLYFAEEGKGAFLEENSRISRLHVSGTENTKDASVVISRSHPGEKLQSYLKKGNFKSTTPSGSSIKGCLVAEGKADIYPRLGPVNEWDICAMHCIIQEAGGMMTNLDNTPIFYNKNESTLLEGFIASNRILHKKAILLLD